MKTLKILHIHPIDSQLLNYIEENSCKGKYIHDIVHHKDIKLSQRLKDSDAYNKLFRTALLTSNPILWIWQIRKIIKKGNYNIIHSHIGWFSSLVIIALFGNKSKMKIIIHVHSLKPPTKKLIGILFFRISKKIINIFGDKFLACSKLAGKNLFSEKFEILENIIDYKRFKFNIEFRRTKRKEFNIDDSEILIGHIGDFTTVKNHIFLINVFNEMLKVHSNLKLFLIGSGLPIEITKIKEIVNNLGITNKIIFAGHRNDIHELMSAFDLFIFPSLHEGFGMSFLESQVSNLPSFVSERIPQDAFVNFKITKVINLNSGVKEWSKIILEFIQENNYLENFNRNFKYSINTKFSIEHKKHRLYDIYECI